MRSAIAWGCPLAVMVSMFAVGVPSPVTPNVAMAAPTVGAYGRLPAHFEANRGQTGPHVKFLARGSRYALFLTSTDAVLALTRPQVKGAPDRNDQRGSVLRMHFLGANPEPRVVGQEALSGKVNYFLGKDPASWRTNVPIYARVRYEDIYPDIDLVFYGTQRHLEYDFVVAPGADFRRIALSFQGADRMHVDAAGDLVLETAAGALRQRRPVIYQLGADGRRQPIAGGYEIKDANRVGFQVAAHDARRPLVIDPLLDYSTYLGGSGNDQGLDIAVDDAGETYVAGLTSSTDFPTTPGAFQSVPGTGFVTKLDATGTALVYSTYLGRGVKAVAVDGSGHAYVTGHAGPDFPTTPDAFQPAFRGGSDAFVTKLDPTGSALVYSTYLGGRSPDVGNDVAVDAAGDAYVAGSIQMNFDFPTTPGAFDTTPNGIVEAFVAKLNATGTALVYSTLLGGAETWAAGIAVDRDGSAYVTGIHQGAGAGNFPTTPGAFDTTYNGGFFLQSDAFVTKLDPTGSALVYSTFLGGGRGDEIGEAIVIGEDGRAYVVGRTDSADFPTTPGALQPALAGGYDAFVTVLDANGEALHSSTYLGGSGLDWGFGIALSGAAHIYVTGHTKSTDFPTTPSAFQPALAGGFSDAFVTRLDATGAALLYSTFLGGSGEDAGRRIAVDGRGYAYVTGMTDSADFPTTAAAFDTTFNGGFKDVFVAKISDPVALSVFLEGGGRGSVTSDPPGISCRSDCSESYERGTNVTLTAIPGSRSVFGGWSGCDAVSRTTCTVSMSAARAVRARFRRLALFYRFERNADGPRPMPPPAGAVGSRRTTRGSVAT